ncbi:DUF4097 family beta strand repeat-containing protein [Streptomyces ginkgonis]|uniref:DUF4097 family beta strand repeat-containing protein n=1 Tax=Streptomyces ginkgonis TaxID=1812259 RepID=UPI002176B2A6|nr:DUF4097 family beta strand repeat-containing protein [Streptomyces ginkgonis]
MRRTFVRSAVLTVPAAVLAAGLSGCSTQTHDGAAEHATFGVTGDTLTVESGGADVTLVPDPGLDGEIAVTRWFTAGKVFGSTDIGWEMAGDTLTLRVVCSGFITSCDAPHEIVVPADLAVTVRGTNGHIDAAGFTAPLDLSSHNGNITVEDSGTGELRLSSHNGKITATGLDTPRVSADTHNGGVTLGLATVPERVEVTSRNGGVRLTVPADGAYRVDTDTGNGSVDVDVPQDAAAEALISVSTRNGGISVHGSD